MADRTAPRPARVVVIGLGRFGGSLAQELVAHGSQVLGIDSRPAIVQRYADDLTHAAVADTTDETALRQLGVPDFQRAVVAIGTDLEASILTTALLADFGIPNIWAKATSRQHGRILGRIGAHHVVLPEHDMGERVAHLVTGRMLDYIEFEDDYAMVKTVAPAQAVGVPLGQSRLRSLHGVTVVAIKRPGHDFTYAAADTVVQEGDILIVAGRTNQVELFADLT
ncbi:trk system potassium uptake protein TrkA [Saccharothrix ecbatanensis]|uniref:Trk system potassium uptake protein TrkA n=1 Tax=Saccharothrix ecbatanensis TaxID=1105145 RepID=A0A7W9M0F5_9PSEU|nr:TrkA family potassium uptake protein [Saccharothrix ecbatanensis]MBB5802708.1 trk system potassium uptake protein TrkA [Saccharothrix ecbatanensis]